MNSLDKPLQSSIARTIDRLKVLINSSTPIVVMETVEEVRALSLVRAACAELSVALFEWTIADGLVRSGSGVSHAVVDGCPETMSTAQGGPKTPIYNTTDPVQALARWAEKNRPAIEAARIAFDRDGVEPLQRS